MSNGDCALFMLFGGFYQSVVGEIYFDIGPCMMMPGYTIGPRDVRTPATYHTSTNTQDQ